VEDEVLSTKAKIALARIAYRGVGTVRRALGLRNETVVRRNGITWKLELWEGIDLAIFLFGTFERQTVAAFRRRLRPGDVAVDIGANIGAHTLHLAECVGPSGRVFALEPTAFAFQKLCANINLNPGLASRILAEQIMLVDPTCRSVEPQLYSSWPLVARTSLHAEHSGQLMATAGAHAVTLDEYIRTRDIASVRLIKLDVDGHECSVLRGAVETITRHRPTIVMEVAPYVLRGTGQGLEDLVEIIRSLGYALKDQTTGKLLPADAGRLRLLIPEGTGMNVVAEAS
jgi:FkbM family methyltransferase